MDLELEILILKAKYLELRYGKKEESHLQECCSRCKIECRYNENHDPETGRFTSGPGVSNSKSLPDTFSLSDFEIGKSLGAKASNYDILDFDTGETFHFAEGTRIKNIKVFAGKGTQHPYRLAERYAERFPGTRAEDWMHVKGFGTVSTPDGDFSAEVHWSECEGIGRVDLFIKRWLD